MQTVFRLNLSARQNIVRLNPVRLSQATVSGRIQGDRIHENITGSKRYVSVRHYSQIRIILKIQFFQVIQYKIIQIILSPGELNVRQLQTNFNVTNFNVRQLQFCTAVQNCSCPAAPQRAAAAGPTRRRDCAPAAVRVGIGQT